MSAVIRDIAIILLAIQTLIVNILLAVLIWQVWRMIKMMQGEVKPIIEDTQDTLGSVRGTANFIGANVVDPVVRTSRTVSGVRAMFSSLTADLGFQNSPRPKKQTNSAPTASPDAAVSSSTAPPAAPSAGNGAT